MYERVKRLYKEGKLSEAGLKAAITKGWITEEEYKEIVGIQEEETAEETTETADETEEAAEETAEKTEGSADEAEATAEAEEETEDAAESESE